MGSPGPVDLGWRPWGLACTPARSPGATLLARHVPSFVPAKHYLAELLRSGQLPAWWPWDGGGAPLLARPLFSLFHPTTLFYLFLPFWSAFTAQDLVGRWACFWVGTSLPGS